jgi:hypothetical protein
MFFLNPWVAIVLRTQANDIMIKMTKRRKVKKKKKKKKKKKNKKNI